MTELSPQARRLLVQLRQVDAPSPEERASGEAAVRRMLEARGMHNLPRLSPPSRLPSAPVPVAARSGASVKLLWLVSAAIVATSGFFGMQALRASRPLAGASAAESALPLAAASGVAPQPEASVPNAPSTAAAAPAPALASQDAPVRRKQGKPADDLLATELRFLSSIDAEIRAGVYDRALRRLQQHKGGALLQEERTAMRVLALCGRDADSRAMRERESFLAANPSSVLSARVRGACTGVPGP